MKVYYGSMQITQMRLELLGFIKENRDSDKINIGLFGEPDGDGCIIIVPTGIIVLMRKGSYITAMMFKIAR